MAIIDCNECKKPISDQAAACPHCGYQAQHNPTAKSNGNIGCIIVIIGAIALAALITFIPTENTPITPSPQTAIDECWKEHDKKSNTEKEKQFIAKTCEMMESKQNQ